MDVIKINLSFGSLFAEQLKIAKNVTRMESFSSPFFPAELNYRPSLIFFRFVMQEIVVSRLFNEWLNRQKQLDNLELAVYVFFFHNEVTIEIST